MKIVFENKKHTSPEVSIILLDWDCRESFHIFNYLQDQTVSRERYEIIWIEYYNRRPVEIENMLKEGEGTGKPPILDKWIVMEMSDNLYYHKHLMYNHGIIASNGKVVTICDSDGIVKPSFVESIIKSFEEDSNIALHMDEVRNKDRRFYPFNFPSIEEITGDGCINYKDGKTTGLLDTKDIIHTRNYGSCMCALREDLINIGGADEHIDYLGHVCGPYEMTYRLANAGKKEVWHQEEFLYHVWHPGTDGDDNYIGPHDGFNMSTTALEVRQNGRVLPLVENEVIKYIRINQYDTYELYKTINPAYLSEWTHEVLDRDTRFVKLYHYELEGSHRGFNIIRGSNVLYAVPQVLGPWDLANEKQRKHPLILSARTKEELEVLVDQVYFQNTSSHSNDGYKLVFRMADKLVFRMYYEYKVVQRLVEKHFRKESVPVAENSSISVRFLVKLILYKGIRCSESLVHVTNIIMKKAFIAYLVYRGLSCIPEGKDSNKVLN